MSDIFFMNYFLQTKTLGGSVMKRNGIVFFNFLLLTVMFLSCTSKQNEKQDMDQLLFAITANDNAWNNFDVEKIVGMFSEEGTLLGDQSELLKGRDAIRKSLETMQMPEKFEFKRDKVEIKLKGNIAYEIVNQVVTINKNQESQTFPNKYIHIWEKQKDGLWRVLIDMNNERTQPTK
jgi:uncharacterized protein (TIGR02246 family)